MGKSYVKQCAEPGYTPNRLLNRAMEMLDLETDSQLARALQIGPSDVCLMRSRKRYISEFYLVRIYDVTGLSIAEMRELMGEKKGGRI